VGITAVRAGRRRHARRGHHAATRSSHLYGKPRFEVLTHLWTGKLVIVRPPEATENHCDSNGASSGRMIPPMARGIWGGGLNGTHRPGRPEASVFNSCVNASGMGTVVARDGRDPSRLVMVCCGPQSLTAISLPSRAYYGVAGATLSSGGQPGLGVLDFAGRAQRFDRTPSERQGVHPGSASSEEETVRGLIGHGPGPRSGWDFLFVAFYNGFLKRHQRTCSSARVLGINRRGRSGGH